MARQIRFVHAADVHLGAPFGRVSATADETVARELIASRARALAALVDVCIERDVDFLVIAGDLFDEGGRSAKAHFDARRELSRLDAAGIAVYLVRGNHDPAGAPDFGVELPGNVRVFSHSGVERIEHRDAGGDLLCALYGRSYPAARVRENYVSQVVRSPGDPISVGVMHADVGGREGGDYAPCSISDLTEANMDYWALGHIHKREIIGDGVAAYCGSPQGLDPNEPGEHGCFVVEIAPGASPSLDFVALDSVRWVRAEADLSDAASVADAGDVLAQVVEDLRAGAGGRPIIARITLSGRTDAHMDLAPEHVAGDLLDEVRERGMEARPWVWVESIEDRTRPAIDVVAYGARADFIGDLIRLARDADPHEVLQAAAGELLAKVGRDVELPDAAELIAIATEDCVDLLRGDGA